MIINQTSEEPSVYDDRECIEYFEETTNWQNDFVSKLFYYDDPQQKEFAKEINLFIKKTNNNRDNIIIVPCSYDLSIQKVIIEIRELLKIIVSISPYT